MKTAIAMLMYQTFIKETDKQDVGLNLLGCCTVLEKKQQNSLNFLRNGNLYKFWASSGIFKNITPSPPQRFLSILNKRNEIIG